MKRMWVFIVLLVLMIPQFTSLITAQVSNEWVPFTTGATPDQVPRIRPKTEDTMGVCIDATFAGMFRSTVAMEEQTFDVIDVPYIGYTTDVGEPMVPMVTRFIEVPPDVDATVEILFVDHQVLDGFYLLPFQEPLVALADAPIPDFTINESAYRRDDFYPFAYATLDGETAVSPIIVRGHRIIAVTFYPVQFNPVQKQVRVCSKIEVRVKYDEPSQLEGILESKISPAFEDLLKQTILNYKDAVALPEKKEHHHS
jgi:hypothetical protein